MAKMSKSQIMEQVEGLIESLNEEGKVIARYNLRGFKKDESSLTIADAKELLLDLVDNYMLDEVEEEEEEIDIVIPSAVENSLKTKKKKANDEEEAANRIVSIIDKKKDNKPKLNTDFRSKVEPPVNNKSTGKVDNKTKKQQDVVMPPKPSEEQIVKLVGYRYSYPQFPLEFKSQVLQGERLKSRGDIKTLKDFMVEDDKAQNGEVGKFYIAVYVKINDIVDPRSYDHCNMYPNQSFNQMLKEYGGNFPQELDMLEIVHLDDKSLVGVSMLTQIPYIFTHRSFNNNNNTVLNCRANYQGLDFQIYQVMTK